MSDVARVVELAKAELSGAIREAERTEFAELVVRLLEPSIGRPSLRLAMPDGVTLTLTGKAGSEVTFNLLAASLKGLFPAEVARGG